MVRRIDCSEHTPPGLDEAKSSVMKTLSLRLRAPLRRYFMNRHVPPHEVDDLVQEVFLKLSARGGVDHVERIEPYVFATASNLLRDRRRHQTSHAAESHVPYDEAVHGSTRATLEPDRILLGSQLVTRMVEALYELPERTRAVFSLYHFEELTHAEIARRLGIALSTVEKNIARANAHLLKRLGL
jgi:RNA polymerase sigma-70 factor (ECF subfamily)